MKQKLLHLLLRSFLNSSPTLVLAIVPTIVYAEQETTCAKVKIEIKQELTFERQAFDAEMKIINTTDTGVIENVEIIVKLTDENGNPVKVTSDPNDLSAKFFTRITSKQNITNVDGNGSVNPRTSAIINWLLIPSPGAALDNPLGKKYLIGATLKYRYAGEDITLNVSPDVITVKPLPRLKLDYFIERDVLGDDPLTEQIEPIVPFTLGVRVKNDGIAIANNVKIDSAQPKIIENKQGLLIDFKLNDSYVDDTPVKNTLLIDFGNIESKKSKTGRWNMQSSLSGRFTEFTAKFTHADELGGALTSVIDELNTHSLIKDVKVDAPGKDNIKDFLALDGDFIRVYESNGLDTDVIDRSQDSTLKVSTSGKYQLSFPPTNGMVYVKLPDPNKGQKEVSLMRSDAKQISMDNVWISQSRNESTKDMEYWFNLFDFNTTGEYNVDFREVTDLNQPPVIQFIPDQVVEEEKSISFIVEASSPLKKPLKLTAITLPTGATFKELPENSGNNVYRASFNWITKRGTEGSYVINFEANDGSLRSTKSANIIVKKQSIPPMPVQPTIDYPLNGIDVESLRPFLSVLPSGRENDTTTYFEFEVYKEAAFLNLVSKAEKPVSKSSNPSNLLPTIYQLESELLDNTSYFWRVRSYDGSTYSPWLNSEFFVNTVNDAPSMFNLTNPEANQQVDSLQPVLSWTNSVDPDNDLITYRVSVFEAGETLPIIVSEEVKQSDTGSSSWSIPDNILKNHKEYEWSVRAIDIHGAETKSRTRKFIVNTSNTLPSSPRAIFPLSQLVNSNIPTLTVANSIDEDKDRLHYTFEIDIADTFDSSSKQGSGKIEENTSGQTYWTPTKLVENKKYYWRVKSNDGFGSSQWVTNWFRVDVNNEPPSIPTLSNPGNLSWVSSIWPTLIVNPSNDPEEEKIRYEFEVYDNSSLSNKIESGYSEDTSFKITKELEDKKTYWWRARATDARNLSSSWSEVNKIFVSTGVYQNPSLSITSPTNPITPQENGNNKFINIEWVGENPSIEGNVSLYFSNSPNTYVGSVIVEGLQFSSGTHKSNYRWDVTNLKAGNYYIYGVIYDNKGISKSYAPGSLVIVPFKQSGSISTISPALGLITTEDGGAASFKVKLNSRPSAEVKVYINSDNQNEGVVTPNSIVFNQENWSIPQTATVTGKNDCISDGLTKYKVKIGPANTIDPEYMNVYADSVPVTNLPNIRIGNKTNDSSINICGIEVIATRKNNIFNWEYDLRPMLTNLGEPLKGIKATLIRSPSGTRIKQPVLNYGAVGKEQSIQADGTVTIQGGPILGPLLKSGINLEWEVEKKTN